MKTRPTKGENGMFSYYTDFAGREFWDIKAEYERLHLIVEDEDAFDYGELEWDQIYPGKSGERAMDAEVFMPAWHRTHGELELPDIGKIISSIHTFDNPESLDEGELRNLWFDEGPLPNECCAWLLWLHDQQWAVLLGSRWSDDEPSKRREAVLYVSPSVFGAIEAAINLTREEHDRFLQVVHLLYPRVPYRYPDWFAPGQWGLVGHFHGTCSKTNEN
ncbi:hypothetical protein ACH9EU_16870 [Kocuria sp. M1R5S2]|uniref:hypothetical protein n=1 Tax=Kocuria rhizosphaerae TaxID=3376285 RepID=UPI0037BC860F